VFGIPSFGGGSGLFCGGKGWGLGYDHVECVIYCLFNCMPVHKSTLMFIFWLLGGLISTTLVCCNRDGSE
jgi:hypothetical protein